jgi:hypothetical protein
LRDSEAAESYARLIEILAKLIVYEVLDGFGEPLNGIR